MHYECWVPHMRFTQYLVHESWFISNSSLQKMHHEFRLTILSHALYAHKECWIIDMSLPKFMHYECRLIIYNLPVYTYGVCWAVEISFSQYTHNEYCLHILSHPKYIDRSNVGLAVLVHQLCTNHIILDMNCRKVPPEYGNHEWYFICVTLPQKLYHEIWNLSYKQRASTLYAPLELTVWNLSL